MSFRSSLFLSRNTKVTRFPGMMERASLFLSFVIWLMQCRPAVSVTVTTDNGMVEVRENSDAVLSCNFRTEQEQNPRIEWKKRGTDVSLVYYDEVFRGSFAGRASIDGATVTLQRVTQEDAGEYRCDISAPGDSITLGETNVTLRVLVPPHTPSCDIPSTALTGSVVRLHCRDRQSIPPATYSWFKDDRPLSAPRQANATYTINAYTGVLEFKTASRTDTGQYRCFASNGIGPPKACEGKHMTIDDINVAAVVAGVAGLCLILTVIGCGVYYAQRNGFFSRHRGRSFWIAECHDAAHISSQNLHRTEDMPNASYSPPPQDPQDFKHTQSFML